MVTATKTSTSLQTQDAEKPRFVFNPSFLEEEAEHRFHRSVLSGNDEDYSFRYMPDDVTRECARRMHYAAYRLQEATTHRERRSWRKEYLHLRDQIVLGNHKLIFRAVRRGVFDTHRTEDLISECYVVMIRAVASYNPWIQIRFSTYAFTCLMRALSRLTRRLSADKLSHSQSIERVADSDLAEADSEPRHGSLWPHLQQFLSEEHPLLSEREKRVLKSRYRLTGQASTPTLEEVGHELGISKERVRQVQAKALEKLRAAFLHDVEVD